MYDIQRHSLSGNIVSFKKLTVRSQMTCYRVSTQRTRLGQSPCKRASTAAVILLLHLLLEIFVTHLAPIVRRQRKHYHSVSLLVGSTTSQEHTIRKETYIKLHKICLYVP